ncbi:unnamed protein product [Meloidogyne enterolobii]|uniref:Uncharacterized protein n=1 Tax=Meloidogyne enterolobii TaxID=390850 RepID=A0ACB1AYG2_MELEN
MGILNPCCVLKYLLVAIATFPSFINAQMDCSAAPTSALRIVCEQLHRWDKNAREAPAVTTSIPLPPAIPGLPAPLLAAELAPVASTPYQCMDIGCLCNYLGGNGQTGTNTCSLATVRKSVRKEYRMLSDDERARFHAALKAIKASGEYDRIATIHSQFATAGSAHSGPGFLPWHREFVKRFEIALKQVDPRVSLPYWDSTLDGILPAPKDSVMFSNDFMGTTDAAGNLIGGDFGGWRTLTGRANVLRRVGADGNCFRERDIQWLLQQTSIEMVLSFSAPQAGCTASTSFDALEYTHGNVHIFIGGDMNDQSTSANDPIFWVHHGFVDMIWELWRLSRQQKGERETSYPMDQAQCAAPQHFASARMRPFEPWNNIDGLSNKYTDNMYEYAPRPTCAMGPNCGSKWLFCDKSRQAGRCGAKIKIGGNCQGYTGGEDVCAHGECQGGICVQTTQTTTTQKPITAPTQAPLKPVHIACYNEHECCSVWAGKGECQRNPTYMNAWCKASCRQCQPDYNIGLECGDRHKNCRQWSGIGECQRNQFWMTENCRQACGKCQVSRAQVCSGGQGSKTNQNRVTQAPPQQAKCQSPGCFNENICCQLWGAMGECRKNQAWMTCNCRVACGMCYSEDYDYGTCSDYHNQCGQWASQGECNKNGWMLENCKSSCNTCVSFFQLRQLCRGARSGRKKRGNEVSSLGFPPSIEVDNVSFSRIVRETNSRQAKQSNDKDDHAERMIKTASKLPESSGMPSTVA